MLRQGDQPPAHRRARLRDGADLHELAETASEWAERADAEGLTVRELVIAQQKPTALVGTASQIAERIHDFVQQRGSDGFIIVPSITPSGLDEFTDTVIPLLQERGSYRSDYEGRHVRDHLGVARPRE